MSNKSLAYDIKPQKQETVVASNETFKLFSKPNVKKHKKTSGLSLIMALTVVFAMMFVVNYRYNKISEKNLELQRLQIKQNEVTGLLMNEELEYSKTIDLTKIEEYAKQQLGMQEPVKSQIVYIESNIGTKVNKMTSNNIISNLVEGVNNFFKSIF